MNNIVEELRECAKRKLAIAPTYIEKSLEWLAAYEIESLRRQRDDLLGCVMYYRDEYTGCEPSSSVLNRMVDLAITNATKGQQ